MAAEKAAQVELARIDPSQSTKDHTDADVEAAKLGYYDAYSMKYFKTHGKYPDNYDRSYFMTEAA